MDIPDGYGPLASPDDQDAVLNLALALRLQWGPELGSPVPPRLTALVTGLDDAAATAADAEATAAQRMVEQAVWDGSTASGDGFRPPDQAPVLDLLHGAHPWVDERNAAHLWSQACYYAWHG